MHTFKDNEARQWSINLTVGGLKAVRGATGKDLATAYGGTLIDEIEADPAMLVDILSVLCERQIAEKKMDAASFAESFSGDSIGDAKRALYQELVDFQDCPEKRAVLGGIIAESEKVRKEGGEKAMTLIANGTLRKLLQAQVKSTLASIGGLSIASPESPESTPTDSPSES